MKFILAIEGEDLIYNLSTKQYEHNTKITISEDVYNWLSNHDTEITAKGQKIFIVNKVRYIYLGVTITGEDLL